MPRNMKFHLDAMSSNEWLTLAAFLFPPTVAGSDRGSVRFYCASCDQDFESPIVTPTKCPHCKSPANDQPQKVRLTHFGSRGGSYSDWTFPFFVT
jgi:Zn finger protein HypA/HybF involved in hydrogenase expression